MTPQTFLLLAESSSQAYSEPDMFSKWFEKVGSGSPDFIEKAGTQAYCFETDVDRVLVFRGTEPEQLRDWRADANLNKLSMQEGGCVHEGFSRALDQVWNPTEKWLSTAGAKKLWITGHSLGGALALLAGARLNGIEANVCTYGQPRVGDQLFAMQAEKKLGSRYCRFVHNRDIVARIPLYTIGFRHFGREFHIADGKSTEVDFGLESIEDAIRQIVGNEVRIPKVIEGVLEPILRVAESAVRPEAVAPATALLRKIQAPFAWFGGAKLEEFFEALITRIQQQSGAGSIGPVDDHDLRHYIKAFQPV